MSNGYEYEKNISDEVTAVLVAAGITAERAYQLDASPSRPIVHVGVFQIADPPDSPDDAAYPTGWHSAIVFLAVMTDLNDDADGASCSLLAGQVRQAIEKDDLLSTLSTASPWYSYTMLRHGVDTQELDERTRMIRIEYVLTFGLLVYTTSTTTGA